MIICVVDTTPTTANANPIFDGNQPVRRVHSAVVLDRRGIRRNRVLAHRGGIHSDRVSHQRASWRDPRPGADELAEPRHGRARPGQPRLSTAASKETWMPGIADKFTQSAKSRLLWPGMTKACQLVLRIKPEMHDVAVGDGIFLALQPQLAGITGPSLTTQCDVIGVGDGFGPDKTLFEIGMNHAGGGGRLGAAVGGPGAGFLGPDGEIGNEVEQLVAGADQAVETGLLQSKRVEKLGALLARQRRDLSFDLGGDRNRDRALLLR